MTKSTSPQPDRFFEVRHPKQLAKLCGEVWGLQGSPDIGPVNTNYPGTPARAPYLVVVLESPSEAEVIACKPAVGSTGRSIFYAWAAAHSIDDVKYDAEKDYHLLAQNGIYITNLVRCQANYDTASTSVKNTRVAAAWKYNRKLLINELSRIMERYPGTPVLFACGAEFWSQIEETITLIVSKELDFLWMVGYHPSRRLKELDWHYCPEAWGDNQRTWPDERSAKYIARNLPKNPPDQTSDK